MTKLIKFDNNNSQMLPSYYSTILNLSSDWGSIMNYESLCVSYWCGGGVCVTIIIIIIIYWSIVL